MEVTIDLPDSTFSQGDVLKWGPHDLIVYIYRVTISGRWEYSNGTAKAWIERGIYYDCAVQGGRGLEGDLIRPGTCTGFPEHQFDISTIKKVEWDNPIIEPDTVYNVAERWREWEAREKAVR